MSSIAGTGLVVPDPAVIPDPDAAPVGQGGEATDAGDEDGSDAGPGAAQARGLLSAGVPAVAVPRIVAFRTRAQLGLVAPRSVSHDLDADKGGVAAHYGGDPAPVRDHAACEQRWRDWQAMHMAAPRGWNDIAYTGGYCSHGYAFAGRGVGVRTAGQGTNDGNQRYYAVCWVNDRDDPTPEALSALSWWVQQLRAADAGLEVWPHRHFHSTSCPGDGLAVYVPQLNGHRLPTGPKPPTPPVAPIVAMVRATQLAVHVRVDGAWGPVTDAAVSAVRVLRAGHPSAGQIKAAQRSVGVAVDGVWGAASKAGFARTVRALQAAWRVVVPGLAVDGAWGPATDVAWSKARVRGVAGK